MQMRTGLLASFILTAIMLVFVGCGNEQGDKSGVSVSTDNELAVTLLTSNMTPLEKTPKGNNILSSLKTKIYDEDFDFSELTYSDSTVYIGDAIYVEGVIPEEDYPADKIAVYTEPENVVSFENVYLTNKDGNTILTFDIIGEKAGDVKVYAGLDDSEYIHYFDLTIKSKESSSESATRSTPSVYTVYCTPTGGKYHAYGCSYLRGSGIAINLEDALAKGLGPCSRCRP